MCYHYAQNAGSAGKRTWPGVHRPNGPQFKMAVWVTSEHVRTKCMSQNSSRAGHRVVAYRGCLTHKPITTRYLVFPRHIRIGIGVRRRDWLCDGGWTLGMGQWDLSRDQCLTHVWKLGIHTHTNFTSECVMNCICMSPSAAEICLQMSSVWGFKVCNIDQNVWS